MNHRPSGYEPDELPGCSIPRQKSLGLLRKQNRRGCPRLSVRRTTELSSHRVSSVHFPACFAPPSRQVRRSGVLRWASAYRAFERPGSDLLSHALRHSTIGAEGLNGRVRNGIGCVPLAITTRPFKRTNPDLAGAVAGTARKCLTVIKFASSEFRFARAGCRQTSWRFPLRARSLSCLFTRAAHSTLPSRMPAMVARAYERRSVRKVRRTSLSSD